MTGIGPEDGEGDAATQLLSGRRRSTDSPIDESSGAVEAGTALGRYVAIEESGRGGMGAVIRAYDPKLQREVALKRLHVSNMTADARARLVREARAMAQLSHPNVVAVHDVEIGEGFGVMVVMEFVRGATLREWLRDRPRAWSEIVDAFVEAGRGLAAAHAVGLLHRDFKPANVLISASADGAGGRERVRVTDFGLARPPKPAVPADDELEPEASEPEGDARAHSYESLDRLDESLVRRIPDGLTDELTSASVVMGTPTYMAPEQMSGSPLTVAADQYAFCVSLWEALAGRPPFAGRAKHLERAKRQGPPPWPREAAAPRSVVAAIRRGLAVDPSERWETMDALLRVLVAASRGRHRWRRAVIGAGATTLAVVGAWALWPEVERPCAGGSDQLADVWNAGRRTRVTAALVATELPYATATATRVGDELDAYAQRWIALHTDACEATAVRGEQSTAVLDLRMACMHRAKLELEAAAELLERADATVVEHADRLVDGLAPLSRCADVDALQRAIAPPLPEQAEAVEHERAELAQARALLAAGKHVDAARVLERAEPRVEAIGYAPLRTELQLERGRVHQVDAHYDDAVAQFKDVLREAPSQAQWDEAATAAIHLATLLGDRLGRPEPGLAYADMAGGFAALTSDPEEVLLEARDVVAAILLQQGKYGDAELEYRAILDARAGLYGADDPSVAEARSQLARALSDGGKFAEAETEYRLALAAKEQELGPEHPAIAGIRNNLAVDLTSQGKYEEAEAELRQTLSLRLRVLGPDHLAITDTRINLAHVLDSLGKYAEAERELKLALAARIAALGEQHPDVAATRNNLVSPLVAQGKYEEAESTMRAAIAGWEAALGREHPDVAMARGNLAVLLEERGDSEEAEALLRAALPVWEKALGADHPDVARGHANLGRALDHQGKYVEAEIELRFAIARQIQATNAEHPEVAATRQTLAYALAGQGRAPEALTEARAALATFERAFADDHPDVARARRVLARLLLAHDGDVDEAARLLEAAWRVNQRDDVSVQDRAGTAFDLARALWHDRAQRPRARELAQLAAATWATEGSRWPADVALVEAWLKSHR